MTKVLYKLASSPSAIDDLLSGHVATRREDIGKTATASAIQAAVGTMDDQLYANAFGSVDLESPKATSVGNETFFDIASITKSLVGATLAMQAIDEGLVDWHTPIAELFPAWSRRPDAESQQATFLHLLNHSSGLPDWRPFYEDHILDPTPEEADQAFDGVISTIVDTELSGPPGEVYAYSDLGYLLLTHLLEVLFDGRLKQLAEERIFSVLGLENTTYVDCRSEPKQLGDAVVTEDCAHRKRLVRGTVHDNNTNIIGGVSTHAGVFGTATDLLEFGRHLLAIDAGRQLESPLVSRKTLRFAWSKEAGSPVGHHRAGWDTPSGERSSAGRGFAPEHSLGHLGFTGTSIWIERQRQVVSILLTNRVYPCRANDNIKELRIAFQEAVLPR